MTFIRYAALGSLTALLLGCAAETPDQPFGAPPPDHNDMTFVDLDGCRWWVIGNALNRSWARQTGTDGKPLCRDEGVFGDQASEAPEAAAPAAETAAAPVAGEPVPLVPAAPAPAAPSPSTVAPAVATAPSAAPLAPTPGATIAPQAAAVPQVAQEPAPAVTTGAAGPFFVQIATFKELANADASAANFVALGYPVAGDPAVADANGLYGLTLGPFASSADASAALQQARTEGFADAFIRRQRP